MTAPALARAVPGPGWLALLGGGEFSFGETEEADRAWLAKAPPGPVAFLPTASGSPDYGDQFGVYLEAVFGREVRPVPIYRDRDARRGKNLERLAECPAAYLGGGVVEHLTEVLAGSPALETLAGRVAAGGVVAAIGAAAQALGTAAHGLGGRAAVAGLGWLAGGAVEANFDPAHDRRLRKLLERPDVRWGVGLPAGAALLLGADGAVEVVGTVFTLADADADLEPLA